MDTTLFLLVYAGLCVVSVVPVMVIVLLRTNSERKDK